MVAGEDSGQQSAQAEGEPARKRARGRPLGSKTKVVHLDSSDCTSLAATPSRNLLSSTQGVHAAAAPHTLTVQLVPGVL